MAEQSKRADRELLQGFQEDIEQFIARSKRAESERAKLQLTASPVARQHRDSVVADMATRAQQLKDAISVVKAKDRERQGRKNAVEGPLGPTPERISKSDDGSAPKEAAHHLIEPPIREDGSGGTRVNTRTHEMRAPLDRYKHKLPGNLEAAGRKLQQLFLAAEAGAKITAAYDGTPAVAFGARAGGVADYAREAYSTVQHIRMMAPADFILAIEWFVTETVVSQSGETMRFEQMGALIVPWVSPDARKGSGYTRFYDVLLWADKYFALESASGRGRESPTAEASRALLGAVRAGAQIRRERAAREAEQKQRQIRGGR